MFKDANILVTGGSGFIATNLIRRLLVLGSQVRATLHNKPAQVPDLRVEFVQGDLRDNGFCDQIMQNIDYVFMCAANTSGAAVMEKTPLAHVTPNVIMNSLCLESAHKAGIKKFIFISSSTVYPDSDEPVKEEDARFDFYDKYFCVGWMKAFSEVMCKMYSTKIKSPMKTLVIRPANSYGPYDDFEWETSHVVPALIRKAVERHNPLEVWGDGTELKDLIYVDDLIEGMLLATKRDINFDQINIATGQCYSIRQILEWILEAVGYSPNVAYNKDKPTMISKRIIDSSKAKQELGFEANVSLQDGIQRTVTWYQNQRDTHEAVKLSGSNQR